VFLKFEKVLKNEVDNAQRNTPTVAPKEKRRDKESAACLRSHYFLIILLLK